MAVVWVFAGGGEAELTGLATFLSKNFPHTFKLQTPIKLKPGPKPGKHRSPGHTGTSLVQQIHYFLPIALRNGVCDKILILDDLDCHSLENNYSQKFVNAALESLSGRPIPVITAFASPEIEAWFVADWENSFKKEFKGDNIKIRIALTKKYRESRLDGTGDIEKPESFSYFSEEKNACAQKLSAVIVDIVWQKEISKYSKDEHSGRMLQNIDANRVCEKCPSARGLLQLKS